MTGNSFDDFQADRLGAAFHQRAQTLTPLMLVRVAMVRELAGDRDGALDAIARALTGGFPQRELEADPEFAELRADARYHRLTAGLTK